MLTAIETTGTNNAGQQLLLDEELPSNAPKRVRVIVLYDENSDIAEDDWLKAASKNAVFDLLNDESEDLYTAEDGDLLKNEI
jgi:hypothetical protein